MQFILFYFKLIISLFPTAPRGAHGCARTSRLSRCACV